MRITIASIRRGFVTTGCLLLASLAAMADDMQESLNLDYFRTPEAAAFKKYGEEAVNEYTGTADISIPLYTVKCKDVEIPIVLRYDASGIKVEQEASWVGLGWNLMVGGCINYVCAGSHDKYTQAAISDQTWMEYLTTMYTFSGGRQYFHYATDNKKTWMQSVPHAFAFDPPYSGNLSQDMRNYLMWGYGERDYYSVNVLGKSFKFFIDPATLTPYIIGEAGDDYRIEPYYKGAESTGIGHQLDVYEWTITDSDGYVYYFGNGDTLTDESGWCYTSSWYLTGIRTPLGETVELSYTKTTEWGRSRRVELCSVFSKHINNAEAAYGWQGYRSYKTSATVKNAYPNEIKTSNQKVTFTTSPSIACSGRRLDAITVNTTFGNKPQTRQFKFTYSTFGYSNIGGNTVPAGNSAAECRLKLDNVKEVTSAETLTTSFSYNSLDLPSKRSCAQDFWGYYNGQNNASTTKMGQDGYTLLPTPTRFMNKDYSEDLKNIKGANRFSCGDYMMAAMLNRITYPTGGYTTYEFEPNSVLTTDFTLSDTYREEIFDVSVEARFGCYPNSQNILVADQKDQRKDFTLSKAVECDLLLRCNGSSSLEGKDLRVQIYQWSSQLHNYVIYKDLALQFLPYSQDPVFIQSMTLPAGSYFMLVIPINDNDNLPYYVTSYLEGWYEETISNPNARYTITCGGLRVKRIRNYDNDNALINYVTYDYNDSKGTTGILLNEIGTLSSYSYSYVENVPNGEGPRTTYKRHFLSGYNISTGQTRYPAFYDSCNPGIVGYSQVTKRKYNADGSLVKSIVTSYINHKPKSMWKMDYYDRLDNGKILCQETRDANGSTIMKVENEYRYHDYGDDSNLDKWYSTNMVAVDNLIIDPALRYIDESSTDFANRFTIWKYPYILAWTELTKTTTTETGSGGCAVKTKNYKYNANHLVSQTDENTSLPNKMRRKKITYSTDATDAICKSMRNAHWLNYVIENKELLVDNGQEKCISTSHTTYTSKFMNGVTSFLPATYATSTGNNTLETRATYSYDSKNNVRSIAVDDIETVYIWSYKGLYPIAKIEGLTRTAVEETIGAGTLNSLMTKDEPSQTDISTIRNAIRDRGGHMTTYTYKPLVGMTSQTLPNGMRIDYNYDGSGRLEDATDHLGILQKYQYNYKH